MEDKNILWKLTKRLVSNTYQNQLIEYFKLENRSKLEIQQLAGQIGLFRTFLSQEFWLHSVSFSRLSIACLLDQQC